MAAGCYNKNMLMNNDASYPQKSPCNEMSVLKHNNIIIQNTTTITTSTEEENANNIFKHSNI